MQPIGVYIHVPWCRHLCPYCDFAVAIARQPERIPHRAYLRTLADEFAQRMAVLPSGGKRQLVSVYLGGGTPSMWDPTCIAEAVDMVCDGFGVTSVAERAALEITLEANPRDCEPARMARWRDGGINRLSIGVQSVDPQALTVLGRDHAMGDGIRAVIDALETGWFRVSADVIFGVPGVDRMGGQIGGRAGRQAAKTEAARSAASAFAATLDALAKANVGHLSVYELTIEERTAFAKAVARGTLQPIDDDLLADMYLEVDRRLVDHGFEHYEISSYARAGQRAVHNTLYWTGGEYLGLGNGAASLLIHSDGRAVRSTNVRGVAPYMKAEGRARVAETIALSRQELARERLWLAMRMADGVPAAVFAEEASLHDWLIAEGLVEERGQRICPTVRGFLYADRIASRLYASSATLSE